VAPTEDESLSRMTIVTSGSDEVIEQINKQLNKLIEVVKVVDLSDGDHIERELMLVKVRAVGREREEMKRMAEIFRGRIIHSASYRSPDAFADRRVVVVGGGNSGAQIVADLSEHASVTWATRRVPSFLPDDIDGRYLFGAATARYQALTAGVTAPPARTLGEIVMVEPVRRARDRGALTAVPMFTALTPTGVRWPDGRETDVDAIVLATGFRPAVHHLASLGVTEPNGRIAVRGTRSVREPRLWLVGYGDWTGYASATLIGVGRSARATVDEIVGALRTAPPAA